MATTTCVFCDRDRLRGAEVFFENEYCMYSSSRDPRDAPDVLPGCGVIVPIAHKSSPFDFIREEWDATYDLLIEAKSAWDARLAPDGYVVGWNCSPDIGHAHMHVLPRFDDEPLAAAGLRFGIKHPDNRRPEPQAPGKGRARALGATRAVPI
jgi:histidine triad (HIT) family protein